MLTATTASLIYRYPALSDSDKGWLRDGTYPGPTPFFSARSPDTEWVWSPAHDAWLRSARLGNAYILIAITTISETQMLLSVSRLGALSGVPYSWARLEWVEKQILKYANSPCEIYTTGAKITDVLDFFRSVEFDSLEVDELDEQIQRLAWLDDAEGHARAAIAAYVASTGKHLELGVPRYRNDTCLYSNGDAGGNAIPS